jgi:hypothetical protein
MGVTAAYRSKEGRKGGFWRDCSYKIERKKTESLVKLDFSVINN